MTRPTFVTEPQRPTGNGWAACEPHRATSFAVVKIVKFTRQRKSYTVRTVLSRHSTLAAAEDLVAANTKSFSPRVIYKLGKRIIKPETLHA